MKRKVKFQEGGVVETPGERRVRLAEDARTRSLELRDFEARQAQQRGMSQDAVRQFNQMPEVAERNERDTAGRRRVGLAERARERELARQEAARQARMDREAAQRSVRQLNERLRMPNPITREEAIRFGAEPAERPANPRPNVPGRAATAAGAVARGASRLVPGLNVLRELAPTSLEAGAEFERAGLAQAREEARMQDRATMEQEMGEAPQRMPTPRPADRSRPRPAAARPAELSAQRLNELADGAEPANVQESVAQMRMQNRRQELEERGTAFKKGGMVKPKAKPVAKKAGGMIAKPKAAPKKMMKGGVVAKPKVAVKSKAKPMPFKKGGVIKKGRK